MDKYLLGFILIYNIDIVHSSSVDYLLYTAISKYLILNKKDYFIVLDVKMYRRM